MEDRNILTMKNTVYSLMIPLTIVAVAAVMRILPHPPNFAPIGALALFSGAHLGKKSKFIIPLSAMLISDLFIRFHATLPFVYLSFILIILIGSWLKQNASGYKLLGATLFSSVLFFLITNFGVWAITDMYTKTASGLMQSYLMALPFFRNTVIADLLYTFTLFYGYNIIFSHIKTSHILKPYGNR